ncbi:cysteine hydrolase family protein [Roseateles noduli]|uniref:cysteine hydrolase family protein n=1 Tax=Roseateles noduli TaxID=2052484 RepID=UPI003D6482D0
MERITYSTGNTALVLVDLLNDFLAEDGKVNGRIKEQLEERNFVANMTRLIAGAREKGLQIVFAPHGLHEHSFDDVAEIPVRMQGAMQHKIFWLGEKGSDFYEPFRPHDEDLIATRHRTFDAFFRTDLDEQLRSRGIERLVMAGLTSHTCIESSARSATELGYHLTFLTDAVAEFTPEAHKAAVEISYPTFGHQVLTIDTFLSAVEAA